MLDGCRGPLHPAGGPLLNALFANVRHSLCLFFLLLLFFGHECSPFFVSFFCFCFWTVDLLEDFYCKLVL